VFPYRDIIYFCKKTKMQNRFRVVFLHEAYAFIETLNRKDREKVLYNIWKVRIIPEQTLFKKLTDTIWEFRTLYSGNHYRLFAFWDHKKKHDTIVICSHGIIKKTDKTPQKEIEKAEKIRLSYFNEEYNEDIEK